MLVKSILVWYSGLLIWRLLYGDIQRKVRAANGNLQVNDLSW